MYVKFEEFEERYFEITFDEITNTNILYVMFSSEIKFRLRFDRFAFQRWKKIKKGNEGKKMH